MLLLSKSGSNFPKITEIRPIAVTTVTQKILEHILLEKLEMDLNSHLAKSQFGFRHKRETLMHIVRLMDRLKTRNQNQPERLKGCLVFIDFTTAFDTIDHQLLIDKIEKLGTCSKETLNLLKWYFNVLQLRIDDSTFPQNRGSPQGGIASPFLWLIYINDLLIALEQLVGLRCTYAFADDLLIYCCSLTVAEIVIRRIQKWSAKNKILLNAKKSAIMPLANRKTKKDKFTNKTLLDIPFVTEYKYLGIVIDYTMNFGRTLKEISKLLSIWNSHKILGYNTLSTSTGNDYYFVE